MIVVSSGEGPESSLAMKRSVNGEGSGTAQPQREKADE